MRTGSKKTTPYAVAEFFAGIGLARIGLESADNTSFRVVWANDFDEGKARTYKDHFQSDSSAHYQLADIRDVAKDIDRFSVPRDIALAWASFPCTDLSLAGGREGLRGKSSVTFWHFTDVLDSLGTHKPPVVTLENVNGFATSHGGRDIKVAIRKLNKLGYCVDVLTLDARRFVPQSRPRLFLVASDHEVAEKDDRRDTEIRPAWLDNVLDDPDLYTQRALLPSPPALLSGGWSDIVDNDAAPGVEWWDEARTEKFKSELSNVQRERVEKLRQKERVEYRTAYRRTRNGKPAWEIRADDIAGCLRTARGGSSKQAVVRIQKGVPLRVRWMTASEYAKLMGAGDYKLPANRNQAIMGFGDAVCVDAVKWLTENYLGPLISRRSKQIEVAQNALPAATNESLGVPAAKEERAAGLPLQSAPDDETRRRILVAQRV
ncbi:DNA cytosine methyltransferase [Actinomadura latina]|uniref:DNA (cytosine-5-)-methyltransferase n=1 Tax=Actinomadura latina TaxID=163603 RepID=A0A846YQU3_9ACTN|nr:DNA cytosine methyltransferase [Actinomadura latina]